MDRFKLEYYCLEYPKGSKKRALIMMTQPMENTFPPVMRAMLAFEDGQIGERLITMAEFEEAKKNSITLVEDRSLTGAKGIAPQVLVRPDGTPIKS